MDSDLELVECLLPNGIVLDLQVHPDDELVHIKQLVLHRATTDERLPLRGCLNPDGSYYSVQFVNLQGRLEECFDETKTLRELKPFQNLLRFTKRNKDSVHYKLKSQIGTLIGINVSEFEDLRNCEINDFRWKMKIFANKIAQERKSRLESSFEAKIKYQYPPSVVSHSPGIPSLPFIRVRLFWDGQETSQIPYDITPRALILKLAHEFQFAAEYAEKCFIKVVGEESFLVGEYRMIDFEYIRTKMDLNEWPILTVLEESKIPIEQANDTIYKSLNDQVCTISKDLYARNHSLTVMTLNSNGQPLLNMSVASIHVNRNFSVKVETLKLSQETAAAGVYRMLGLEIGIFHGGKPLCQIHNFNFKSALDEDGTVQIQKVLEFDLPISCLPRAARLCMGVYEKKRGQMHPLFWINTTIYDYKAKLKGQATYHMWNYSLGDAMPTYNFLSPLRQSICNPNMKEAADIVFDLSNQSSYDDNVHIEYPTEDERYHFVSGRIICDSLNNNNTSHQKAHVGTISKLFNQELERIADRDPLHDLTFQEKDLIWKIREYCKTKLPELLPRIIDCVDYRDQFQVFELSTLLKRWPLLSPERALQLLDYAYPDENVRRFAVKCLAQASDEIISRYLLQLAQALKHESYFHCDLVEFLLERALTNQHIGHHLFWELKAEMNSPFVGLLFGLILETYLTAAPEHLKILEHQNTLLEKCRGTHMALQKFQLFTKNHERAKMKFESSINYHFVDHPYVNFVNPLNPTQRCLKIKLDKCKLMKSKMRPQMLAFENMDCQYKRMLGHDLKDIVLMYKRGDDLRQDRLTLQLLKVMDLLWKDSGLDLHMSIYGCISTEISEGLINVVLNAETICRIQMLMSDCRTSAVFKKGLLLAWLKTKNVGAQALLKAQQEFTRSCAAYTVAMYILGIGDRHNDNIMVKHNGQMFHVDYGHFLGNFKHKFGIKRERVPMILSSEFIEVIRADLGVPKNFERFISLCERAFLTIRKQGSLIISLLTMMISTGLPELNSEQDLNIIRLTLQLDRTDEEAIEHFRKDFNESLRNAWTISLDWWFHAINQVRSKGRS